MLTKAQSCKSRPALRRVRLKYLQKHIVSPVSDKSPVFQGPAIVMPYMPMSLRNYSPPIPSIIRPLATQIFDVLEYIHARLVFHRDIKPGNILIFSLIPFEIKLTDFGVSSIERAQVGTMCGTLRYMAPEVKSSKSYDAKADVWSAGVVLAEYCLPEGYFRDLEEQDLAITPADVISSLSHVSVYEEIVENVLKLALVENPKDRKLAREVREAILLLPDSEDKNLVDEETHVRATSGDALLTDDDATIRLSTVGPKISNE